MWRRVKTLSIPISTNKIEQLPCDATLKAIDILITGTVTFTGSKTVQASPFTFLRKVELRANGHTIRRLSGYELYSLQAILQGERFYYQVPTATGEFTLFYRLWLQDPVGLFPNRTLFDTRDYRDNFEIELTLGDGTDLYTDDTGITWDFTSQVWYDDVEVSGRPQAGGNLVVYEISNQFTLTGTEQIFDWKEKGRTIRSFLLVAKDNTPAYSDDVVDKVILRLNGKTDVIREVPWEYLKAMTTLYSGLDKDEIPTGVVYYDFDGKRQGMPLLSPELAQIEFIPYKETGATSPTLDVIRRAYGSIQGLKK